MMNWAKQIFDKIFPPGPSVKTYHIQGYKADGVSQVWAAAMSPEDAIAIYKSLGGDVTKSSWV